ncbi:TetR/AcrR family transcriptional regulator [Salibaculum halophilum]|uniref:TetR/AcrR family transcriptional regulator n=1 Tax=Salibaculum halophilum TaxID=1914408 RepID=UPI000A0FFA7B|nr:TetR/AcrR family transcriptional regulator [Salibaculum halophilum]
MIRLTDPTLDAALRVVSRYGMRRTTMADIAREAGVSRQTLYDRFGDKDGVMAAAIRCIGEETCAGLRAAFAAAPDLAARIDAYYRLAVWPVFDMMETLPDAADLEHGMGPASQAASREAEAAKRALLAGMLRQDLPPACPPAEDVAAFVEQASSRAKMSGATRPDLARFLAVLRAAVLALARP